MGGAAAGAMVGDGGRDGRSGGESDALGVTADLGLFQPQLSSEHTQVTVAGGLGYVEVKEKESLPSGKGHQENARCQSGGRGGRSEAYGENTTAVEQERERWKQD